MTVVRRRSGQSNAQTPALLAILSVFLVLVVYLATMTDETASNIDNAALNKIVKMPSLVSKRKQLRSALDSLTAQHMPMRLYQLRETNEIVGERLSEIKAGTETVEEVLHGVSDTSAKPPMELQEITNYLTEWIHTLHDHLADAKHATYQGIWQSYHDLAVKTLYPWDRDYLKRMPRRRNDGSIFLSLATYRDENCISTISQAYKKAKNPEKLFVGLVQQNCHADCRSGILEGGKTESVEPDQDCYKAFCDTEDGRAHCAAGRVRPLDIDEPESLGPYAARYFASKLWYGEQWFMQTDAHMTFAQDWDAISVDMLKKAPSKKPVLSHYPPSETANLDKMANKAASRLCGPVFATSDLEAQIIRLEGAANYDQKYLDTPRFAPFTAAGYFVAHSGSYSLLAPLPWNVSHSPPPLDFLREVPFDPFLPWIFMGEEIIMSTRLWTAGYDIFSPSRAVVGHIYVRRHKPKFWESVHRAFSPGIHNPLQMLVLNRIKYQLGYPESAKDMIKPKNLLTAVEQYSMGTERPLEEYLRIVGMNMTTKLITKTGWCETGRPPPGFEEYAHYYD